MAASVKTFSLPCVCEITSEEEQQDLKVCLNEFLSTNISERLTCVKLRAYQERRRGGSGGVWYIELQDASSAILSETQQRDMKLAARRIGGVLKGYDENCCLVLVTLKHLHPDHPTGQT